MNLQCPICHSNNQRDYPARCSPFLAERIWNTSPFPMQFISCNDCGFMYYYPQPTDKELEKLYNGYRSTEYEKQRQKHEPDYSNAVLYHDYIFRHLRIYETLKNHIDSCDVTSVLDYGGGDGSIIPPVYSHANRYVYDISGIPIVDGVKPFSLADTRTFDLILCCHVLEHVNDPHEAASNIAGYMHDKSILYLEVPTEYPFVVSALKFFSTHRRFYYLYAWLYGKDPEGMFPVMHEHINLFTEPSLRKLLEMHNLDILYMEQDHTDNTEVPVISVVAKLEE